LVDRACQKVELKPSQKPLFWSTEGRISLIVLIIPKAMSISLCSFSGSWLDSNQ